MIVRPSLSGTGGRPTADRLFLPWRTRTQNAARARRRGLGADRTTRGRRGCPSREGQVRRGLAGWAAGGDGTRRRSLGMRREGGRKGRDGGWPPSRSAREGAGAHMTLCSRRHASYGLSCPSIMTVSPPPHRHALGSDEARSTLAISPAPRFSPSLSLSRVGWVVLASPHKSQRAQAPHAPRVCAPAPAARSASSTPSTTTAPACSSSRSAAALAAGSTPRTAERTTRTRRVGSGSGSGFVSMGGA